MSQILYQMWHFQKILKDISLDGDIENFARDRLRNDIRLCKSRGQKYIPVIWPGFSWGNLQKGKNDKFNQISRRGGAHLWHQVYSFIPEGADGYFGANFDEVDEGTAWYKILSSRNHPDAADNNDGKGLSQILFVHRVWTLIYILVHDLKLSHFLPFLFYHSPKIVSFG